MFKPLSAIADECEQQHPHGKPKAGSGDVVSEAGVKCEFVIGQQGLFQRRIHFIICFLGGIPSLVDEAGNTRVCGAGNIPAGLYGA